MKGLGKALLSVALFLSACDPFGTSFDDVEGAVSYRAANLIEATPGESLKVMTYNIKFGGARLDFFFDCHGDRVLMTEDEVISHLSDLAEFIRLADPDIVFLQEADVLSKRSAYIDQVQFLLDQTELNYGVYASQWKADFVPSDGLGPVDSGNAILSKFRLSSAKRIALPLIEEQGSLTRYFYLKRNILRATLEIDSPITLLATHTAAYAQDGTKAKQIAQFEKEIDATSGPVIAGGDLNTLPPDSPKWHDFSDSVCTDEDFQADDYREEMDLLEGLYDSYQSAISLDDYHADPSAHFTHTVDGTDFWNRKLDYLFTNLSVVPGSGTTHQDRASSVVDTMPLSDHAPITVEFELP